MAGGAEGGRSLLNTSTWAIAAACGVFIVVSLLVERLIHLAGHLLTKHKQTTLLEALEKIKDELMLVGFISLALTVGQEKVASICVPTKWATKMLLCKESSNTTSTVSRFDTQRRILAAATTQASCPENKEAFITQAGLHQLHILLFVLAVVHVCYSLITMAFGMWRVHMWKFWEEEAKAKEPLSYHGTPRFTRETSFVRSRGVGKLYTNPISAFVVSFFRQFFHSVTETDYQTLRHGFIKNHMPQHFTFDFHKYILRSLQDDFKHVVGISTGLWAFTILTLLLNVDGWVSKLWFSFVPLIMVLIVGTKLQYIMTRLAVRITQTHAVSEGMPDVTPQDDLFWFSRPQFILFCIHVVLFQNAMELSFHIWVAFHFSSQNCLNSRRYILLLRILVGALTQILCGYITLPTYALVAQVEYTFFLTVPPRRDTLDPLRGMLWMTRALVELQMGSHIRKSVFDRQIQLALVKWRLAAKRNIKESSGGKRHQSSRTEDVEEGSTSSYTRNPLSLKIKPLPNGGEVVPEDRMEAVVQGQNSMSTHEMVMRQRVASPVSPNPPPPF